VARIKLRNFQIFLIRKTLKLFRSLLRDAKDARANSQVKALLADKVLEPRSIEDRIPRVIFQTGPSRLINAEHFRAIESLKKQNPTFEYYFFDDQDVLEYMDSQWSSHSIFDIFQRVQFPQMRADIFRYCLIFERGGFYLDFNKMISKPLADYVGNNPGAVVGMDPTISQVLPPGSVAQSLQFPLNLFAQYAFGFQPRHGILENMIARISEKAAFFEEVVFSSPRDVIFNFTGPGGFTEVIWDYLINESPPGRDLEIVGIAFDNSTTFRLPSSKFHGSSLPHYSQVRNRIILSQRHRN